MRAGLRIRDLKNRQFSRSRLMNVKVPMHVSDAIERVADGFGASKTEVVIALLNEGLVAAAGALKVWVPPPPTVRPPQRLCTVAGCERPHLARGYCANHYQALRRGKLQLPA
jgi:hypothetical protein